MAYELIKVSELPELTTPSDPNVIPIQDGDYLKRISFENLKEAATGDVAGDLAAEVTAREGAVSGEATARGNADTAILADLASPYSASATYAVGDYCTKDGQLYRCTTAISTAEAWTAAHWSAVALGDDTSDLRSAFNSVITFPESSAIAKRITSPENWIVYDDTGLGLVKFTSLSPYNGKLISSSGYDSYVFRTPYGNYSFGMWYNGSEAYVLSAYPVGKANETLDISEALTPTTSFDNKINIYSVSAPRGSIVLFTKRKTDLEILLVKSSNKFTEPLLELDSIQDTFARYSVRENDPTAFLPFTVTKVTGKLVSSVNGTLTNNASYDTYYFQCPISVMSVTCKNAMRCVITNRNPTEFSSAGFMYQVVYEYAAGRVETFNAYYGQYVIFSVDNGSYANIDLKTDYVRNFTLPTLRLSYGQKGSFYKIVKSGTATYVYICYASGNKIVQWELHNVPAAASNSDTWQIGHVMGYNFDGTTLSSGVELVAGGEFELAFKEHGATDFCGGNNHGDENTDSFTLHIDGKAIDFSNIDNDYHPFNRIDAIEEATVNRCDTPSDDILSHQKIWTFENGEVRVRQTIKYLESLQVDGMLVCMFAANRSVYPYAVRQGSVAVEDMSAQGFTHIWTKKSEVFCEMFGDNTTAKISSKIENGITPGLWINDTATLNKLYYEAYSSANSVNPASVESGTVVCVESIYNVAYN